MGESRKELAAEKSARQQFEERLGHLEQHNMGEQGKHMGKEGKHAPQNSEDDDVDKSVVVGGFVGRSFADAEKWWLEFKRTRMST